MNKFKKAFSIIIMFCIATFSLPMWVSANAPSPADHLTVVLSNIPDNAMYADLLIKIDKNDDNYIDFQTNNLVDSVSKAKSIVDYSEDSFYSFTFHYKNSKSSIKIEHHYDNLYSVNFCKGLEYEEYLTQYENLRNYYSDIKIALLDKDFNIIAVSETAQLPKENDAFVFDGEIYYDFDTNVIDVDTRINLYFVVIGGFFSILIMLMSIVTEIVIALLFRFKNKWLITILVVNACSQILMRVLYIALPLTYLIETIVLEVIVYILEFFIYKKYFKETSVIRILGYTVIANTLSLLFGIFLDCYILA